MFSSTFVCLFVSSALVIVLLDVTLSHCIRKSTTQNLCNRIFTNFGGKLAFGTKKKLH